jgi:hypothetical protein
MMLGSDPEMAYLIRRYARQSGYGVITLPVIPKVEVVCELNPAAIFFTTIESLEAGQLLITGLATCDIPVLVCSSVADQAHARELGADNCLLHPLMYECFHMMLAAIRRAGIPGARAISPEFRFAECRQEKLVRI